MSNNDIENEVINNDTGWLTIILLLFAFSGYYKGVEEQCTETIMDTTIQQDQI